MTQKPTFWFAIPVHNRIAFTRPCLDSIRRQSYGNYRVVLCDDGSVDGTGEILSEHYPEVTVLQGDGNLWWTGGTNKCIEYILDRAADTDYVVTLNNDLELSESYLQNMADVLATRPEAILMSASHDIARPDVLVEPGERIDWWRAKAWKVDARKYNHSGLAEVTHAPGRGTVFSVQVFRAVGLYAFEVLPQYGADYDLALRARRAGYRIYINYDAKLYSHVAATGSTGFKGGFTLARLYGYLTDIKSPASLKYRWRFARRNCPPLLLPSFMALDTMRVLGSFLFKRKWKTKSSSG